MSELPGNILREATERLPKIDFDFGLGRFEIAGESYPENVIDAYGSILDALREYVETRPASCRLDIRLTYFNSASAKALMVILQRFDDIAAQGGDVKLTWYYDAEDENMLELGEDFGENLTSAEMQLQEEPN
jgi:hypothetical protein